MVTAGIVERRVAPLVVGEVTSIVDAHKLSVDAVAFATLDAAGVAAGVVEGCQGHVTCGDGVGLRYFVEVSALLVTRFGGCLLSLMIRMLVW